MKVAPFALLATSALPFAFASVVRSETTIPALLRSGSAQERRAASEIIARQAGVCDTGYLPCSDGTGCCPVGQYCGTWGGKPGCCPIGKNCVANSNPCTYVGDVLCPGETFCCPAGDTCYRDSFGAPKCSVSGGGSTNTLGGITNTLGGSTNTLGGSTNTVINTNTLVNTPSATFITTAKTTAVIPTNTVAGGAPAVTTTVTSSGGGNGLSNPFSSNGAMGSGVNGLLLVAAGVAANFLMAAH